MDEKFCSQHYFQFIIFGVKVDSMIDGVDYGPLAQLLGKWVGTKGLDVAPDSDAQAENSLYTDEIIFSVAGPAENAEAQELVAIQYHHVVRKIKNGHIFHDQVGHWIYERNTGTIMHSLSIPRGVCLLAGGKYQEESGASIFHVKAREGNPRYGIVQSPFMHKKAQTKAFEMTLSVTLDEMSYQQITSLHIYQNDFEHIDKSSLSRVIYDH